MNAKNPDLDKLSQVRNQYLLYSKARNFQFPDSWISIGFKRFNLSVAPDLPSYVMNNESTQVVLLGMAFHIENPDLDEYDILQTIPDEHNDFLDYIDKLSGNFIILKETQETFIMLNDTGAAMKIFYHLSENGSVDGVASDPEVLKKFFCLVLDESKEALEFYNSSFFKKNKIRLGDRTKYEDVFQLLPNHLLDLHKSKISRFFPRKRKENLSVQESVDKLNTYLNNVVSAAARKNNIKCALTAGWDSRMVLAATKEHKDKILYYTFNSSGQKEQLNDIAIAQKITDELNLTYKIIDVAQDIDDDVLYSAKNNYSILPRKKFKIIMNGFSKFNKTKDLALLGLISEIGKNYYGAVIVKDGKTLTKAAHFKECKYVIDYQQKKYNELQPLCNKYGYDIRDIAHWEQDITNFAGQGIQYNSFMLRTFSPFNSREIIKTILATPRSKRDNYRHKYFKQYLKTYFPELLSFPINPTLKKKMIVWGKITRLYYMYKILVNNVMK